MVVGSNPVAVTSPSDFAPASSKEFLDIQATIECGFTLKRVRDRTINVWNIFNIKNTGEYHDLYLKTDVLLLYDVFEKFINVCLMDYGLNPCHYFSSPGLAWDAMLN